MKRVIISFIILTFAASCLVSPAVHAALKTKTDMPELLDIPVWFNTPAPVTRKALSGKVVLLHFWNYSNIHSLRHIEIFNQWYNVYRIEGLEIIGILTPDFEFEKDDALLKRQIERLKIRYPIAFDIHASAWRTYHPPSKSAIYLMDAQGKIQQIMSGKMDYQKIQDFFQEILKQNHPDFMDPEEKLVIPFYGSYPDIHLGYKKLSGYGADKKIIANVSQNFTLPSEFSANLFYLAGDWKSKEESLEVMRAPASLIVRHSASILHLLAGSTAGAATPAEVRLDHQPLTSQNKGKDVVLQEGRSYIFIKDPQLYEIFHLKERSGEHKVEILFEEPGIEVFQINFE